MLLTILRGRTSRTCAYTHAQFYLPMAYKKDSSQTATYSRRLKDNVKSILDNYVEIVNQSKV